MKPRSTSERVAKHRARGQQVAVVLTDPAVIEALQRLQQAHGSKKAAISAALVVAASQLAR